MTTRKPSVHLATTSDEVVEYGEMARQRDHGKIILAPVDFSAHSEAALKHACKMADALKTAVVALHVVHDPGEMPGYYSKLIKKKRVGRIQDMASEVFADFMERLSLENPGLASMQDAERLMVIGLPVSRILEVADTLMPELVVVGSQGRTGLQHMLIGSKAAQIVQLCPVPITVVKGERAEAKD